MTPVDHPYPAARLRTATFGDRARLDTLYDLARGDGGHEVLPWLEQGGALLIEADDGRALSALLWREDGGGWHLDRIATVPDRSARTRAPVLEAPLPAGEPIVRDCLGPLSRSGGDARRGSAQRRERRLRPTTGSHWFAQPGRGLAAVPRPSNR